MKETGYAIYQNTYKNVEYTNYNFIEETLLTTVVYVGLLG